MFGALGSIASSAINAITGHNAGESNYAAQKEFATHGIRWKVADAKAAGIHPLAALGSQTASFSPSFSGTNTDLDFSDLGQDISRAAEAKMTPDERALNQLQREKLQAEIEYTKAQTEDMRDQTAHRNISWLEQQALNSQLASRQQQQVPAMPRVNATTPKGDIRTPNAYPSTMEKPIKGFGSMMDPDGKVRTITPSSDMASLTEDKFIIEWIPFISSFLKDLSARVFGTSVGGLYWHGSKEGYKPYPPHRKTPNFTPSGSMVYDHRGR